MSLPWTTHFHLLDGTNDVTTGHGATYSLVSTSGCTATIDSSTGLITVTAVAFDNATATFRAIYGSAIRVKTLTIAKAKAGPQGADGAGGAQGPAGPAVVITADKAGFTYSAGALSPASQTITYTATLSGVTGTIAWTATNTAGTTVKSGTGASFTVNNTEMGSNQFLLIKATVGTVFAQVFLWSAADPAATPGATWGSNVASVPSYLSDGRVGAGLDTNGDLARSITSTIKTSSNILSRTGGGTYAGDLAATQNNVTYSATAPASPVNGDIWVDTSVTPNVTKVRVAGAWQVGANLVTSTSHITDGAGLGTTATWTGVSSKPSNVAALTGSEAIQNSGITLSAAGVLSGGGTSSQVDALQLVNAPAVAGATKNIVSYASAAPTTPANGDIWTDTSGTVPVIKHRVSGAWQSSGNLTTNTTQLTDGANLGGTATWTGVSSKPANVGALTGTEKINNASVTIGSNGYLVVDGSTELTGLSKVANTAVTIDSSGILQGIGTASKVVDNTKQLWSDVSGTGRPEDGAAVGDALNRNASAFSSTVDTWWGSATRTAGSAGDPSFFVRSTSASGLGGSFNSGNTIAVVGGETLYVSALARQATGGLNNNPWQITFSFYTAAGASISAPVAALSPSSTAWTLLKATMPVPANAAYCTVTCLGFLNSGAYTDIANPRIARTEVAATAGATWGTNVANTPANLSALAGTETINNASIAITSGKLVRYSGDTGLTNVIDNSLISVDGSGLLQGIGTGAGTAVKNSLVALAQSGTSITLSGGGTGATVNATNLGVSPYAGTALPLTLVGTTANLTQVGNTITKTAGSGAYNCAAVGPAYKGSAYVECKPSLNGGAAWYFGLGTSATAFDASDLYAAWCDGTTLALYSPGGAVQLGSVAVSSLTGGIGTIRVLYDGVSIAVSNNGTRVISSTTGISTGMTFYPKINPYFLNISYADIQAGFVGSVAWSDFGNRPANLAALAGTEVINNASITIDGTGTLVGIGTASKKVDNAAITVASGVLTGIGTANVRVDNSHVVVTAAGDLSVDNGATALAKVANSKITIGSNGYLVVDGTNELTGLSKIANSVIQISSAGVLTGAGGGTVTIGGLGFTGDLNASASDNIIVNANLASTSSNTWWGAATRAAGTNTDPAYYAQANNYNTGSGEGGSFNGGAKISTIPGDVWFVSAYVKDVATIGVNDVWKFNFTWYAADGTTTLSTSTVTLTCNSSAWVFRKSSTTAPANAAWFTLSCAGIPFNGPVAMSLPRVAKTEQAATVGADWTSNVTSKPANLSALAGTEVINNASITVASGVLTGIGTANVEVDNSRLNITSDTSGTGGRARVLLNRNAGATNLTALELPSTVQNKDQLWTDVSGSTRPDNLASAGDNLLVNSVFSLNTAGTAVDRWTSTGITGSGAAFIRTTDTSVPGAYLHTAYSAAVTSANSGNMLPVTGGATLFISAYCRAHHPADWTYVTIAWYDANGNGISPSSSGVNLQPFTTGTWVYCKKSLTPPNGAAQMIVQFQPVDGAGTGTFYFDIAQPRIGSTESGATYGAIAGTNLKDSAGTVLGDTDVKNAAITISSGVISGIGSGSGTAVANSGITLSNTGVLSGGGTSSQIDAKLIANGVTESGADVSSQITGQDTVIIYCDSGGTPKTGELTKTLAYKLYRSGAALTSGVTWTQSTISGTGTTAVSGTGTCQFDISAISTDQLVVRIFAAVSGSPTRAFDVTIRKQNDPPAVGGTGGSGNPGTSASTSTISSTASTTYGSANTSVLSVVAGTAGTVSLTAPLSTRRSSTADGSTQTYGKWQWRAVGGVFADVAAEIASTVDATQVTNAGDPAQKTNGSLSVAMSKTGLTSGTTYEFQLLLRKGTETGTASTITFTGTAQAAGS